MSIFLDTIDKIYSTEYPNSIMGNISWGFFGSDNSDILDGYLHSLYIQLNQQTYYNLLAKYFPVNSKEYYNLMSVYVNNTNEVSFVKLNGEASISDPYLQYDIYTCSEPIVRTLDFTDLIYTTDSIKRRTERQCLKYQTFKELQFVAKGKWRDTKCGCLVLGTHYTPKDFTFPVCLNTRRIDKIPNQISSKDRQLPIPLSEIMISTTPHNFLFYYTSSKCKEKWNNESLNEFMNNNHIPESIFEPKNIYTKKNFT